MFPTIREFHDGTVIGEPLAPPTLGPDREPLLAPARCDKCRRVIQYVRVSL